MALPLVSIITPTYNHGLLLRDCVASVMRQTYVHWEQLIVDDGSDWPAEKVISDFKDHRIRVISQDRVGINRLADTYNRALRQARGSLVAVLEGDDLWPPRKLEVQVPAFEETAVALSWGRVQVVDCAGCSIGWGPLGLNEVDAATLENAPPGKILGSLLVGNIIPAASVVVRRSSLESVGGFRGSGLPYVDYPTWLNLALTGRFHFTSQIVGVWRRHERQASTLMLVEIEQSARRLALDFFDQLPREVRDLIKLERRWLVRKSKDRLARAYLGRGRVRAAARMRRPAMSDFGSAFRMGRLGTRVRASTAGLMNLLGLDIEPLARRLGRSPLPTGCVP